MSLTGNVLVAQGGGPTAVINHSLVGVVIAARRYASVQRVYGALNGVKGIIDENFIDLTQETTENLKAVAETTGAALLSTRDKPDSEYCSKIFDVMKAHDIRWFFYIGGNDSSDTVRILKQQAKEADYEFRAVHIPKTIDNDLVLNDHTPGYGSAARFVAEAFMGINNDNRALPGIYIGVVMGRHAGFLTAASCLAQVYPDDGPHLIYVPERPFCLNTFIEDVKKTWDKFGRCVVAVSEGIQDENGEPIITQLVDNIERDSHGNVQLSGTGVLGDLLAKHVKQNLDVKRVRTDTFGYLQRSFMNCVSDVDAQEAREVAERAVQYAVGNNLDGSVVIKRIGRYTVDYERVDVEKVGGKTRHMPDEYINEKGNNVTDAFWNYVRALVGSGFPHPARLRAPKVPKILNK